jgi:transposase
MGHTEWSTCNFFLRVEATTLRLPELIGEPSERGNLKTDQRERETMGPPTRGDSHGGRAAIVIECLGQCPGQGEGPQGDEKVRDRAVDAANHKGISGQGRLRLRPGEPCAMKVACTVREAAVGNVPKGNALAAYFIDMTAPITLTSLEKPTLAELRRRYEETTDAETRTRYQMLLLSQRGQTSSQIAQSVLRSQDTVVRVLKRFLTGGLDAVPRRTAPGRQRRVTAAWEAELLRVIELDPHEVGQETANWTTERLAAYLCQQTGIHVTEETVRVYLHAHGYVCKRSTWTLRRKAEEKTDYVGNACG